MPRLIYTPGSPRDIERLDAFLRKKDPDAAKTAVRTIRESPGRLAKRPEIGRPARRMTAQYREWSTPFGRGGYALYRTDRDVTVVLAVRHMKEAATEQAQQAQVQ